METLGTVSCPSGDILLLDFGLLRLWSGDAVPILDADSVPPGVAERANSFADFEVVGVNARAVADRLDLAAVKGRYAFDLPADGTLIADRVNAVCEAHGWQASIRPIERMPHHQRLLRLLEEQPDGVEVPFHGIWGVAVRGVPGDCDLPVRGTRMDPEGPDAGRWRSVWVEIGTDEPVRSVEVGCVLVDEARLIFTDPVALKHWRSDEAIDGRADVVFWGRDSATVAEEFGAGIVSHSYGQMTFGWTDLPVADAFDLAGRLHERHSDPLVKFAFDFRPHDDHYSVLTQMRASKTESGTIRVAEANVTGFFTSWGDGAFPVFRDIASDGRMCRLRVELAIS